MNVATGSVLFIEGGTLREEGCLADVKALVSADAFSSLGQLYASLKRHPHWNSKMERALEFADKHMEWEPIVKKNTASLSTNEDLKADVLKDMVSKIPKMKAECAKDFGVNYINVLLAYICKHTAKKECEIRSGSMQDYSEDVALCEAAMVTFGKRSEFITFVSLAGDLKAKTDNENNVVIFVQLMSKCEQLTNRGQLLAFKDASAKIKGLEKRFPRPIESMKSVRISLGAVKIICSPSVPSGRMLTLI